jgi:hypothetical protein
MELWIHDDILVQLEGVDSARISEIGGCPARQTWRGGDQHNDWVWDNQHLRLCYGPPNGRVLWQLQSIFKIKLLNYDGALVENRLALALTMIPVNYGNSNPISRFVAVRKSPAAIAVQVSSVGNIHGCGHTIPGIVPSCNTGDRWNEPLNVNSHIDLAASHMVYKKGRED